MLINASTHDKKKDTIYELLVVEDQGLLKICKTHKQTSNKIYSWCVSPYKYSDSDKADFEDKEGNKFYTNRKTENKQKEEEMNPSMAMFLQQQQDENEEEKEVDQN